MDLPTLWYMVGFLTTMLVIIMAGAAFIGFHRSADLADHAADEFEAQRAKLPDATRLDDLRSRIGDAEDELDELREELRDAQALIEEKRRAQEWFDRNKEELRSLEANMEQIEKVRAELEAHRKELESLEAQAKQARREADAAQFERDRTKEQIASLNETIETKTRLLQDLDKQLAEKRATLGPQNAEEAQAELWEPALTSFAGNGRRITDESDAIDRVHRHLENNGLVFSDRAIRAVHTSLKVAEESPLLVLAGISGTGKSELPRRYAEALGIHFLPVPVQPRWDSPQDIFGFFNYLEGRYRPTELTRALLQMDPIGPEKERGWLPPDEFKQSRVPGEMLLVLLDEMNLARVEYYFSELLSRLEMRRNLDLSDRTARQKVEIPLEVSRGSSANGEDDSPKRPEHHEAILRLLVDTNVLFVGTMNEDESTQTLSDKVIDRSNLLRFGKPGKLRIENPSAAGADGARTPLQFDTWTKWQRSADQLSPSEADDVEGWIEQINGVMHQVGRPFAFRVHRAMKAYVANYPDQTPEGVRHAMADQVEFRILPRLRGLDPQEREVAHALQSMKDLAGRELADDRLATAIDASQSANPHQFAWLGLDRSGEDG